MKKIIAIIIVCSFLLSACNHNLKPISSETVASTHSITKNNNSDTLQQPKKEFASINKNNDSMNFLDFETAYDMCKQVLTEYHKQKYSGYDMDFSKYIKNKNLINYLNQKIKNDSLIIREGEIKNFGVVELKWIIRTNGLKGNRYLYLNIIWEVVDGLSVGASETSFIIQNINGKLIITDWYEGIKASFDTICRGDIDIKDDLEYWDEKEKISKLQSNVTKYINDNKASIDYLKQYIKNNSK